MANSPSGDSMVNRIVRILDAFQSATTSLTVAEIASRADLPSATAYRLIADLTEAGLLEKADREVHIGVRLWELAERSSRMMLMRQTARPFLDDLRKLSGQDAALAVLDGMDALYVDIIRAQRTRNIAAVAKRMPAYACSAGLAMISRSSKEVQDAFLASEKRRYTSKTVTDPLQLRRMLDQARREGYARAKELIIEGSSGLAATVEREDGRVLGAVTLVVPTAELDDRAMIPLLRGAAAGLGRALDNVLSGRPEIPMVTP